MAEINRLELSDLADFQTLEQLCFADEAWSETLLRLQLSDRQRSVFGWKQPDLLGFACFLQILDEAELLQIGVLPRARGQGIAQGLLQHCLLSLQQEGVKRVLLEVRAGNLPAQRLYETFGFVLDGRRTGYYPASNGRPAEDALLMSLDLESVGPGE